MQPPEILDATAIPPRVRHPTIFAKFDALAPGQAFQLVNDHDPIPLYYQFQMERPGLFAWEKIENGPETWRVNISRT